MRMLGHLQTLLQRIVQDPQAHLSDVSMLTDAEREQLLVLWNATRAGGYLDGWEVRDGWEGGRPRPPRHTTPSTTPTGIGAAMQDLCIHELIEQQVERTPERIAVVFEEAALTYRDLDMRANQLAHYLQTQGVGPEVLVGVCLERSLEMVVALLGILKAGGAYVPLDPAYPKERVAFMLSDARAPVLLTQETLAGEFAGYRGTIVCMDRPLEPVA